jgi:hypothetical protein
MDTTGNYNPVSLSLNAQPRMILETMKNLTTQNQHRQAYYQNWRRIPLYLLISGIFFIAIDLVLRLLGYQVCIFSWIAPAVWIAALVIFIRLRRAKTLFFSPLYQTARDVIYTLRDDGLPGKTFFGRLDLTGTTQESKLARESTNALGLVTQYYRDEWLNLKMKLYDGSMLRFSAIERIKQRKGYWKRGSISGKQKWKPPMTKGDLQELKISITGNPQLYDTTGAPLQTGSQLGGYLVSHYDSTGGITTVIAQTGKKNVTAEDILPVLQGAYHTLVKKDTT